MFLRIDKLPVQLPASKKVDPELKRAGEALLLQPLPQHGGELRVILDDQNRYLDCVIQFALPWLPRGSPPVSKVTVE